MKYFIKRDLNEYGPYALADLQRYVAQGNIVMTDLARSEGLTDWVPVSQILGNIPVPVPAAPGSVYGGAPVPTVYGGAPGYGVATAPATAGPMPPDLHWALVLLIGFFCGFFYLVWLFVEASYVKKLRPMSNFMGFLIAGVCLQFVGMILSYASIIAAAVRNTGAPPAMAGIFLIVALAGWVLQLVGLFKMRDALQDYYNTTENIGLRLSGVMTFFFSVFYFQYHLTRISEWKKTGVLQPQ